MKKQKAIEASTIQKLFRELDGKIRGDWVLLGGSLLPVLGAHYRVTYDIDLACVGEATQSDSLALFTAAEKVGLPIEAVNTAAAYFLHRIAGFQKSLLPLFEGKELRILRPDLSLYWRLKLARLSESDVQDCLAYLKSTQDTGGSIDLPDLQKILSKALAESGSDRTRKASLQRLGAALYP